ncbi:hypothetical protein [Mitsuaria sp. GD03876]|uniref:hypothetical protein n=1 Tax=Mitsuaria sp. GD03876 TaxID=2975399 RepID=UPI00244889E8|nr:hypothetical protein [Mitsuaria sp. GD03876]MDH0863871.1 hypothetical protein [Mitsuaria sp. GD03876]
MTAPPSDPNSPRPRGDVLGYCLIAFLAALTAGALRADGGMKSVLMGLTLIAWSLMFLASVRFSDRTFFLRGLRWFCENLSWPSTPKMAFFYAAVTGAMGIGSILAGLGLV